MILNLFNIKNSLNELDIKPQNKINKYFKNYPSPVREWNNSIYVYNKYAINLIPATVNLTLKILKSYFFLFNKKLAKKVRKKRLRRRFKRLTSHKIYISNAEYKHTNNKVLITIYLFNRQQENYKLKIKKSYLLLFRKFKTRIQKKLNNIKYNSVNVLLNNRKKKYIINNISDLHKINNMNLFKLYKISGIKIHKKYNAMDEYYKKLTKICIKKIKMYFFYKQLLHINNSKLNYTYLQTLKANLEKLYNKNVEFNLVNLKYFYLNGYILSESLVLKIRKNRRKLLRLLNKLINKVKVNSITDIIRWNDSTIKNKKQLDLNKPEKYININQKIQHLNKTDKEKIFFLGDIKHKYVSGLRILATGRLTKRYTASKSVSKLKYKGNLINITSSIDNISNVILRNNLRTNIQYTKLKSKTRIGSFGIKGWVSSN